jgi:hypothetical protein
VLVFLSCDFVRGFEKGKVRIVIELGVLKSGKGKECGDTASAITPRSLTVPLCYDPMETPLYHGGFGDVWKCEYRGVGLILVRPFK